MSGPGLRLSWKSHDSHIIGTFEKLWESRSLCDCTLACQGGNIRAHKVILSACSPYFQELFEENPCQHPTVILKDVSYTHLVALLHFIYRGEVEVDQADLPHVIMIAASLRIRELAEIASHIEMNSPTAPTSKSMPVPPLKRRHDGGSLVKGNTNATTDVLSVGSQFSGENSDGSDGSIMNAGSPSDSKRVKCSESHYGDGNGVLSEDSFTDHHDQSQDSPSSADTAPNLVELEPNGNGHDDEDEEDQDPLAADEVDSEKDPMSPTDDGNEDDPLSPQKDSVDDAGDATMNAVGRARAGDLAKDWMNDAAVKEENEPGESGPRRPHKCSLCGKGFRLRQYLSEHLKRHLAREYTALQQMDLTQSRFLDMAARQLEVNQKITSNSSCQSLEESTQEQRPYQCHVCLKAFKRKHHLTDHLRLHTGEKRYKCYYCNECFVATSIRARHIAKCHYRPNCENATTSGSPPSATCAATTSQPKTPQLLPIKAGEFSRPS